MRNVFVLAVFTIPLFGCSTAALIAQSPDHSAGVVRYKTDGHRKYAIEKIETFCSGPYEIQDESEKADVTGMVLSGDEPYLPRRPAKPMFIRFSCKPK